MVDISNNLTVLTVATHTEGYLNILKRQLETKGINHHILGYGKEWRGWLYRINLILHHLRTKQKYDDLVMVVDGYDVLLTGSKENILSKYNSMGCDIVFSVHKADIQKYSPLIKFSGDIIGNWFFSNKNKYMKNGGSFMGKAGTLRVMYSRMLEYATKYKLTDDQVILNNISLQDISYTIDTQARIFWIWESETLYEVLHQLLMEYCPSYLCSVRVVHNRPVFFNGTSPEVIHGIGHRDMSLFVEEGSKLTSHRRRYIQRDMEIMLKMAKYGIILGIILVMFYIMRLLW